MKISRIIKTVFMTDFVAGLLTYLVSICVISIIVARLIETVE